MSEGVASWRFCQEAVIAESPFVFWVRHEQCKPLSVPKTTPGYSAGRIILGCQIRRSEKLELVEVPLCCSHGGREWGRGIERVTTYPRTQNQRPIIKTRRIRRGCFPNRSCPVSAGDESHTRLTQCGQIGGRRLPAQGGSDENFHGGETYDDPGAGACVPRNDRRETVGRLVSGCQLFPRSESKTYAGGLLSEVEVGRRNLKHLGRAGEGERDRERGRAGELVESAPKSAKNRCESNSPVTSGRRASSRDGTEELRDRGLGCDDESGSRVDDETLRSQDGLPFASTLPWTCQKPCCVTGV